jgi:hypothetical protein
VRNAIHKDWIDAGICIQESKFMKFITLIILVLLALTACQSATPSPITGVLASEFTLAPDQTVTIENTGLSIKLISVTADQRCPSEIECAMSGPVSLSIAVQKDTTLPIEYALQTFTSNNGRAPDGPFEGIDDRIEYEGYTIQVKSVLPYPAKSFDEIRDSEYRVSFLVTAE